MKSKKIKSLIISGIVCLLPILLGILLWDKLPDRVAIHFNFYNEPDNFASKEFAVFGLPFIMLALHIACNLIKFPGRNNRKTPEIMVWIIPVVAVVAEMTVLLCAVGCEIDIRLVAALLIVAVLLIQWRNRYR